MSERYTRIFEGESDLYAEGSPVMISAAVLLNDTETSRVIAQMKFRSLSEKKITYLKVRIKPFDMLKNALSPVEFEYTDLSADMYDQFGQKTPVVLPDTLARSYEAAVIGAAFSDGTVWKSSETEWHPDSEREKEAIEICRKDAVYTFAVSKMAEHTINGYEDAIDTFRKIPGWKDADKQIAVCLKNIKEIKVKEETNRLEYEREAEEQRINSEEAAKKRTKVIAIVISAIIVCIALVVFVLKQ